MNLVLEDARVLVVEDNDGLRRMMERSLTKLGVSSLRLVERPEQAIELLSAGLEVDLLLSDIRMPGGMDGVELAQWTQEKHPKIRILLQTGYSDYGDLPFPVLEKPYDLEQLRRAMSDRLDGS